MPLRHRYLFVGGLHRSGTSLVARMAASLPGAGGIQGAPVPENEGVYLQGAIPHDALKGRPMRFATDPAEHLTEASPLNRLETRQRMEADWTPWFRPDLAWRVEKSPVNLTRMRLLQQLFPLSQFLVVLRHPEAVAAAMSKWTDRHPGALMDHWLEAHERLVRDLRHLHAVLILRYEDVVRDPGATIRGLSAFLDVVAPTDAVGEPIRDGNTDYPDAMPMTGAQTARAARWGYGPNLGVDPNWSLAPAHPLRDVRDATSTALGMK
ncbi:sulfotransferase [Jannaschia sp. S6380]|uniref:sulfotransferase family protein n=1 Tax=Jannaschia sp. S6380 TaxID=2926408 RepID=UPI001FF1A40D|nr:sulfotransferase [Jannaschia sp. S6380]MCK0168503.1 sulfotransferase [Jannaschia sp. S6380]